MVPRESVTDVQRPFRREREMAWQTVHRPQQIHTPPHGPRNPVSEIQKKEEGAVANNYILGQNGQQEPHQENIQMTSTHLSGRDVLLRASGSSSDPSHRCYE